MTKLKYLPILLLVLSCKGKFITEVTREPFQVKTTRSCTKCDICLGFDGSYSFNCLCTGTKKVIVEVTPYEGFYEKEPDVWVKKTRERVIRDVSECD